MTSGIEQSPQEIAAGYTWLALSIALIGAMLFLAVQLAMRRSHDPHFRWRRARAWVAFSLLPLVLMMFFHSPLLTLAAATLLIALCYPVFRDFPSFGWTMRCVASLSLLVLLGTASASGRAWWGDEFEMPRGNCRYLESLRPEQAEAAADTALGELSDRLQGSEPERSAKAPNEQPGAEANSSARTRTGANRRRVPKNHGGVHAPSDREDASSDNEAAQRKEEGADHTCNRGEPRSANHRWRKRGTPPRGPLGLRITSTRCLADFAVMHSTDLVGGGLTHQRPQRIAVMRRTHSVYDVLHKRAQDGHSLRSDSDWVSGGRAVDPRSPEASLGYCCSTTSTSKVPGTGVGRPPPGVGWYWAVGRYTRPVR